MLVEAKVLVNYASLVYPSTRCAKKLCHYKAENQERGSLSLQRCFSSDWIQNFKVKQSTDIEK